MERSFEVVYMVNHGDVGYRTKKAYAYSEWTEAEALLWKRNGSTI